MANPSVIYGWTQNAEAVSLSGPILKWVQLSTCPLPPFSTLLHKNPCLYMLDWWLVCYGCHYCFIRLYKGLFDWFGMIYLWWQWWWHRRERSLSWLIQWHLTDPPIDQMNFPELFIINISTIVIFIAITIIIVVVIKTSSIRGRGLFLSIYSWISKSVFLC